MNSAIWTNPTLFRIYSWVILRASWKEKEVFPTKNKVKIIPGQFIISYRHAAEELKVSVGTLKDYLDILISEHIVERQATNKYTILTVLNWDWLQDSERQSEHRLNTDRTQTEPINTLNTLNRDNTSVKETETKTSKNSLLPCCLEELKEISARHDVALKDVELTHEKILNKIKAKEFKGKTIYYTLNTWVLNGIQSGWIKKLTPERSIPHAAAFKYH